MDPVIFIDTEVDAKNKRVLDIGGIKGNGDSFHSGSISGFVNFLKGGRYIGGHNILKHDLKYIHHAIEEAGIANPLIIDTLSLSPLLFPAKPYHKLLKDDKLQSDELNNPLNDAKKARNLFYDEVTTFNQTDKDLKDIYYLLLKDTREFSSFFDYTGYKSKATNVVSLIRKCFEKEICHSADLSKMMEGQPVALAYCLALINTRDRYSITPPWVIMSYPEVASLMYLLRNNPCIRGCDYCNQSLDIHKGLKRFFGFDSFKSFNGIELQKKAVRAAVHNGSLIAVFPTGGGKSLTFQLPALMSGENEKGLTVVISPLQSLMKDQVDNLEKEGITEAVTINGLLDPIEREKSFERVEEGLASILYISPESLRTKTIEHALLGRNVVRFVIDEAHCFSSWGHDFRVDYLYIGDFIRSYQEKKDPGKQIPVSCFTATAKQNVISDIKDYFREKLNLELEVFSTKTSRSNLQYKVIPRNNEDEKYTDLRNLIEEKDCPTIVYVSRTRRAYDLAKRLDQDGYPARPYHGKMDKREKSENQDAFINGEVGIIVATSAFGMGVDKKDVGLVVHFDISDSLENYIQEAGRAGRDEDITADCYVLFNEEDLGKHFTLLNQTKLSIKEIGQVWKAIKGLTRFRSRVSNSALEIARKAGWDESITEIENRVTTAIAALEEAGYLKRGQNMPRIFANSILSRNAREAIDKINASELFDEKQKIKAIRIIKKLISSKSRKQATDEAAESRVDYISDHLGIVKKDVINIINLLREEKILADTKDLTAFITRDENLNRSLKIVESFCKMESFLLSVMEEGEKTYHIKDLNELAEIEGCTDVTPNKFRTLINFWTIKNWIKRRTDQHQRNHIGILCLLSKQELKKKLEKRHELARSITEYLYEKSGQELSAASRKSEQVLVEFSVHELKENYEREQKLFKQEISIEDIEEALFFLSRIEALKIEGGFLVIYNRLDIERIEKDNKKRYKIEDYRKLEQFYENKVQQIHIVGEYAKKMISDYKDALQFVEDYFHLNYYSFLDKYFKGSRQQEIRRYLTPSKFQQLFGELSITQLKIINDSQSQYIAVAAGPGSGKTRILVHKLASLLMMEDVKHEQLLMVTFSRAAATEFKKRLLKLIGNAANFVEIRTFHSYCFDLLGKMGSLEKSDNIVKDAVEKIRNGEVEISRITKTVLVIDEAQDMDEDEFSLVNVLMDCNEEMRVIAVGDDDQNIYEFRGSSSEYLYRFMERKNAVKYELVENFRSRDNLVRFTNQFAGTIRKRMKTTPITAHQRDNGYLKLVTYAHGNLIVPVVDDILATPLSGTTCVLTKTNDEALQVTGLLLKSNRPAKLIQTNDQFSLYNVDEVRYFLGQLKLRDDEYVITDELWRGAKRKLWDKYRNSSKIELCIELIKDFDATNPVRKYRSDLEVFIRESRMEDFYGENGEKIFVSTMHKAKGNEFDNVFLLIEDFRLNSDKERRLLYVAMTRAKKNLVVHTNETYLNRFGAENLERRADNRKYGPPAQLLVHLTHKDVWLDYFGHKQGIISRYKSGDRMRSEDGGLSLDGMTVLKFSDGFKREVEKMKASGYEMKEARINFILWWRKEDVEGEIKIILPEVVFERREE